MTTEGELINAAWSERDYGEDVYGPFTAPDGSPFDIVWSNWEWSARPADSAGPAVIALMAQLNALWAEPEGAE